LLPAVTALLTGVYKVDRGDHGGMEFGGIWELVPNISNISNISAFVLNKRNNVNIHKT